MPKSSKELKGKVKESIGNATGDDKMKREGQAEQVGEKAKKGVDKVVDKVTDGA